MICYRKALHQPHKKGTDLVPFYYADTVCINHCGGSLTAPPTPRPESDAALSTTAGTVSITGAVTVSVVVALVEDSPQAESITEAATNMPPKRARRKPFFKMNFVFLMISDFC